MLTKEILSNLPRGTILHHTRRENADGTPLRARVNGRIKTWKRDTEAFQLPMKHGLRDCFYITPANVAEWTLPED